MMAGFRSRVRSHAGSQLLFWGSELLLVTDFHSFKKICRGSRVFRYRSCYYCCYLLYLFVFYFLFLFLVTSNKINKEKENKRIKNKIHNISFPTSMGYRETRYLLPFGPRRGVTPW